MVELGVPLPAQEIAREGDGAPGGLPAPVVIICAATGDTSKLATRSAELILMDQNCV